MEIRDQMLVSLDLIGQEDILLKKVSASYMEKPVRNLVEYMLDHNGDSLNPGYNQLEREIVGMINRSMRQAEASPYNDGIEVLAETNNDGDPIHLKLENKLSDYESQILQRRPILVGDQSVSSLYIRLYVKMVCCCCRYDR